MTLRKRFPAILTAVVLVLLPAVPALAVDMCFETDDLHLFVVKSFKKPAKGQCKPLAGYDAGTTVANPATGTACLNSSGTVLYVHWTVMDLFQNVAMSLRTQYPYPSLTGGRTEYCGVRNTSTFCDSAVNQSAFACQPAPLP
jgi:hypothetical protein